MSFSTEFCCRNFIKLWNIIDNILCWVFSVQRSVLVCRCYLQSVCQPQQWAHSGQQRSGSPHMQYCSPRRTGRTVCALQLCWQGNINFSSSFLIDSSNISLIRGRLEGWLQWEILSEVEELNIQGGSQPFTPLTPASSPRIYQCLARIVEHFIYPARPNKRRWHFSTERYLNH